MPLEPPGRPPAPVAAHVAPTVALEVRTRQRQELVDVTDEVSGAVGASGLADGTVHVFCPHTSCGLAITEAEDGLHEDLARVLEQLAPAERAWAHDDLSRRWQNLVPGERPNGHSHIRALLSTAPSVTMPLVDGGLGLGRWQRVFLVELDGARPRRLLVQAWGVPAGPAPGRPVA